MITRRGFLRSAGGLTLLALRPAHDGLFAATSFDGPRLPLFTTLPYNQPGPKSALDAGHESMVVAWQTQAGLADFKGDFGATERYGRDAVCAPQGSTVSRRHGQTESSTS